MFSNHSDLSLNCLKMENIFLEFRTKFVQNYPISKFAMVQSAELEQRHGERRFTSGRNPVESRNISQVRV